MRRDHPLRVARVAGHSFLSTPLRRHSVVVDLGVNEAEFALGMLERYGCRVVGVEPAPALFAALPLADRLTVEPCAVTGDGLPATLYVDRAADAATIEPVLSRNGVAAVAVEGVTLAGLLDRHELERAALVKVDIEGAEVAMLEAAGAATLQRADQYTIEFHDFLDAALVEPVARAKRRLHAAGFAELALSRDNTDVLFVNTARIAFGPRERARVAVGHKYPQGLRRIVRRGLSRA